MAQYLGVHKLEASMSEEDVVNGFNAYKEAASKMGLKPLHVHLSVEKEFAYCLTEAPSADEVRTAHEGIAPLEDVIEVKTVEA